MRYTSKLREISGGEVSGNVQSRMHPSTLHVTLHY